MNIRSLLGTIVFLSFAYCSAKKIPMMILSPVANLRASPHQSPTTKSPALSVDVKGDGEGQISQLLFGEYIMAEPVPAHPGWLSVLALEQVDQHNNPFAGYIETKQAVQLAKLLPKNIVVTETNSYLYLLNNGNFVKKMSVPFGAQFAASFNEETNTWELPITHSINGSIHPDYVTELSAIKNVSKKDLRKSLITWAQMFVGTPYVWGGRSLQESHIIGALLGIDCSNLASLLYHSLGITIPRNSRSQLQAATRITSGKKLQPGDLIFFTGEKNKEVCHVALYLGNNKLIEANSRSETNNYNRTALYDKKDQKNLCVRIIDATEYLKIPITKVTDGMVLSEGSRAGATIFLGSFL